MKKYITPRIQIAELGTDSPILTISAEAGETLDPQDPETAGAKEESEWGQSSNGSVWDNEW